MTARILILAALLATSGCATSPEEGQRVANFVNAMAAGAVVGASMRPQPVPMQRSVETVCNRYGNRVQCWSY